MSESAETTEAQAATESTAQAAKTEVAQEAATTTAATTEAQAAEAETSEKTFDADYVKQLRKEAAQARKDKQALEARVTEFENAKLSAEEKATKERDEANQRADAALGQLKQAHLLAALAKNEDIADAQAAAKLVEGVEYDDAGQPTNLTERVAAAIESYPVLKKGAAKLDPADPANPESRKRTAETQSQALARIHSGGGVDIFEGASVASSGLQEPQ